jgi:hypothetical protein
VILTLSPFESFVELASLELELEPEVEVGLEELELSFVILRLFGITIFIVLLLVEVLLGALP